MRVFEERKGLVFVQYLFVYSQKKKQNIAVMDSLSTPPSTMQNSTRGSQSLSSLLTSNLPPPSFQPPTTNLSLNSLSTPSSTMQNLSLYLGIL